jgi:glycosyltransferase involved in cell wall biosynthesis
LTDTIEHLDVALPDLDGRVRGGILAIIPAYNEAENVGAVVSRVPDRVCGLPVTALVVDDGSSDSTVDAAEAAGAVVARHLRNRGGGAALRTGYALASDAGAAIVVTLDADGQHLPEEMTRLVRPIVSGRADAVNGSRTLGSADPNTFSRELGLRVFNRVLSTLTRTDITDCSSGYRAIRAESLAKLDLRQEQFHASEWLIEAVKRGLRLEEVPITVAKRMHGETKKPATLGYGLGFTKAVVRTWLR